MSEEYEVTFIDRGDRSARFLVRGVTPAFANGVRRAILADVPTLSIDSVRVIENSSVMFDEPIALRLGLIPLTTPDDYRPDVYAVDAGVLDRLGDDLCHLHGRVRRRLVAVLLHDRAAGGLRDGLGAGQVRYRDYRVVERGIHVGDAPGVVVCHVIGPPRARGEGRPRADWCRRTRCGPPRRRRPCTTARSRVRRRR